MDEGVTVEANLCLMPIEMCRAVSIKRVYDRGVLVRAFDVANGSYVGIRGGAAYSHISYPSLPTTVFDLLLSLAHC